MIGEILDKEPDNLVHEDKVEGRETPDLADYREQLNETVSKIRPAMDPRRRSEANQKEFTFRKEAPDFPNSEQKMKETINDAEGSVSSLKVIIEAQSSPETKDAPSPNFKVS